MQEVENYRNLSGVGAAHPKLEGFSFFMSKQLSIFQFADQFGNDLVCRTYLENLRWPDGVCCPYCGVIDPYKVKTGYKCNSKGCRQKFSLISGTIFSETKLDMNIWFLLIYMSVLNKKNISSVQISKNLGVTQTTAWGIMHKIRTLLKQDENLILSGVVEIDEAFLGGGTRFTGYGRSTKKSVIIGMVERGGRVVIKKVPDRKNESLNILIQKHVEHGSTIYTDGWLGYRDLNRWYDHDYVDHGSREYTKEIVHTNTIENVWRQLKSSIKHAHHSVGYDHVQKYCDEVAYRINNKGVSVMDLFNDLLLRACNYEKFVSKEIELIRA